MPAMPIADSRPPIVVGIRHTSSATSTVIVIGSPWPAACTLYSEYGSSVAQASRKISVNLASRMVSAISFGVLRRVAPSTMAIMRSRKLSPGLLLMRTMIQSDSTRVPPVTELRSPPDSRMTGADSPVIALSSTVAAPSMISPSPGMNSPALTMTRSSLRRSLAEPRMTVSRRSSEAILCAMTSRRAPRSDAACALPRPSAIASAKFANSSVNHSHSAIAKMNLAGASP